MTREAGAVDRDAPPRRILEVGPGTGSFTNMILDALRAQDELDLVEMNPVFCRRLEERVLGPYLRQYPEANIRLHEARIQDLKLQPGFDSIVCSLPFNSFPPVVTRAIFRHMFDLLGDSGVLTYFEHIGVRRVRGVVSRASGRRRLRQMAAFGRVIRRRHSSSRELVLWNVPPAYAYRLKRNGTASASER